MKQRKNSCIAWSKIKNCLIWACNNTNLHGFNFVVNKNSSIITRLLFAFISCLSLGLCTYLIILQFYEYDDRFIVSRTISTSYPVWKFRFPATTICNFNVVYNDNIKNLMNLVTSYGIKEDIFMDFVQNLSALIAFNDNLGNVDHYKEIYQVLEQNGYDVDRTMEELAQPCDKMIKKCFWRASEIECSQIIQKIKTSNGYCCSFNYYGTRKVPDGIIDPQNLNGTYMGLIGSNNGLRLIMDVEKDQYISSIKPAHGFSVLVRNGVDYPDMLSANTLLKREEMKVSIKSNIFVSSEDVRDIDLMERQCLFEDEGNMTWSSVYSYRTCLSQCRADAIYKFCGCVPFYYSIRDKKRVCTFFDEPCLEHNKDKYTSVHLDFATGNKVKDEDDDDDDEEEEEEEDYIECRCYPQCNERILNVLVNRAVFSNHSETRNLSVLNVYYNADNCVKTKKEVGYTWYRILSVVGGIFSLCLGGSIISIVECFYIFAKCIYNNIESDEEKILESHIKRINVMPSKEQKNKPNKKAIQAQMFVNAFGNK